MFTSQTRARFRRPGQRYGAITLVTGVVVLGVPVAAALMLAMLPQNSNHDITPILNWLAKQARIGAIVGIPLTVIGILVVGFTRTKDEKDAAKKQAWKTLRQQAGGL
ncbi:hypothetical protein [Algisphaera agarilytica]|uniref:Uncharacterized membrane protein HdeD (DUF308 family) n=1 Tax=Algisphaera agarilytica TaxID=1385975 RepID=A0A7X0H8B0_9BACT|nr:hypothetical protein [Algisphaera agarilytica]MBB6431150.1 uncharacterized membrane protein HdeD (DUF308 family) [Algisphaera agarilytica]